MTTTGVKRVLSIQSHVVHGYVGNKVATFPLQVGDAYTIKSIVYLHWFICIFPALASRLRCGSVEFRSVLKSHGLQLLQGSNIH